MQVVHTFDELAKVSHDVCLAIGVFDGVHLGHQRVIGQAREAARAAGGTAVVLTFDPHPVRVLAPTKAPPLLTSTAHKLRLIAALGVDACLVLRFDQQLANTSPTDFIDTVARSAHSLKRICVGSRFRFGHNRSGDVALIARLGPQYGYVAEEITSVTVGDEMISSTAVRQHVLHGNLDRAQAMLGRRFSVLGTVVRGDTLGRQLGYPTANINPHNEVLPANGVYAVLVHIGQAVHPGMANIGVRPTVQADASEHRLEVHLLDFTGDLYGQDLEVEFCSKLRAEQKFDSLSALRAQLARDEHAARSALSGIS